MRLLREALLMLAALLVSTRSDRVTFDGYLA
jgi:hypothetical protein